MAHAKALGWFLFSSLFSSPQEFPRGKFGQKSGFEEPVSAKGQAGGGGGSTWAKETELKVDSNSRTGGKASARLHARPMRSVR